MNGVLFMMTKLALSTKKINNEEIKSILINTSSFLTFFITSLLMIIVLYLLSGSIFIEIFKWLQFVLIIMALFFLLKKINIWLSFLISSLIYFVYISSFLFFIFTNFRLDFYFIFTNIGGISVFSLDFFVVILVVFAVSILNIVFLSKFEKIFSKNILFYIVALILLFFPAVFNMKNFDNEAIAFAKSIYQRDLVINHYQKYHQKLIEESKNNKNDIEKIIKKEDNYPKYLDNIIVINIESLNSYLVNEKITPNFLKIAKEGVLFKNFYGNSIETHLSQENMLCSLPTSFHFNLVQSGEDKSILCLPEIFNTLGYKTFFLKSYDLNFTRTGEFMNNIGFDEVHADDIMQKNDPKYIWGYREDVFYQRALDFFQKNKNENNFLYLQSGPTSHWPFFTPGGLENSVPYKNPKNHQERIANTTFLQDQYLKIAWERINEIFPEKNYTLIISGDHSWPIEIHKKNLFNQKNSFEENFRSSMIIILGNDEEYKDQQINSRYSQLNVMPSLLDLFNIDIIQDNFRSSFIKEMNGEKNKDKKIIFIQPYSDKYINIIKNNAKYQYNSKKETFLCFDLQNDPLELDGKVIGRTKEKNFDIIKKLLPL